MEQIDPVPSTTPEPVAPVATTSDAPAAAPHPHDTDDWDALPTAGQDDGTQTPRQTRRRARSQQATPEDVPRIQELTKKLREAERERDEIRAKLTPAPTPAAPSPSAPRVPPPQPRPAQPLPQAFPTYDAWSADPDNANKSYDDYTDARADWRWALNDAKRREQAAVEQFQQTRAQRLQGLEQQKIAARQKYADFDQVVAPVHGSAVMVEALIHSDHYSEILYHLGQHPDMAQELMQESFYDDPRSYSAMKRHLESLVAPSQRSSHQPTQAAQSPDRPLALVPPPAPKPPNPVRTSAMKPADALPTDEDDLEAHAKVWGPQARARHR